MKFRYTPLNFPGLLLLLLTGLMTLPVGLYADEVSATEELEIRLEKARQDLRIAEATRNRIKSEREAMGKQVEPRVDAETLAAYDRYLERVEAIVKEQQRLVDTLEAMYVRHVPPPPPGPDAGSDTNDMLRVDLPDPADLDEVAQLERELRASLSEFDGMLLEEMNALREELAEVTSDAEARTQAMAREAADAAREARDRMEPSGGGGGAEGQGGEEGGGGETESPAGGSEPGTPGGEAGQPGQEPGGEQAGGQPGEAGGRAGGEQEAGNNSGSGNPAAGGKDPSAGGGKTGEHQRTGGGGNEEGGRSVEGGRSSGANDDIVERQLREAAEKEKDPVLREKLWKEYEDYKKARRR